MRKWGGTSLREHRPKQWFPLTTPSGEIVFPYRNDGNEGHWRWGKDQKMKTILADPLNAHWELCPFDDGVTVNGVHERWVPFEKLRDKKKAVGWGTWLDQIGFNSDATRELKDIFGSKPFDTPKPTSLIEWLISLHNDDHAIILDSFAGSGTTAHAVLKLNAQDGGNRKFILVEMMDYAETITAERVRRVMDGYGEPSKSASVVGAGSEPAPTLSPATKSSKAVEGLGGGFEYYTLGEALFNEDGQLNEVVGVEAILRYVAYTERVGAGHARDDCASDADDSRARPDSSRAWPAPTVDGCYYLGETYGVQVYFIYQPNRITTLDLDLLAKLAIKPGKLVIYADQCLLGEEFMRRHGIIFKKIPRDITRF